MENGFGKKRLGCWIGRCRRGQCGAERAPQYFLFGMVPED